MQDEKNNSHMNEALYSLLMVLTPSPSSVKYPPFMMLKVQKGIYLPPLWCRNLPHPFPSLFHWYSLVSSQFPRTYVEFCQSYGYTFVMKNVSLLDGYMNIKLVIRWLQEHGGSMIDTDKEDLVPVPSQTEESVDISKKTISSKEQQNVKPYNRAPPPQSIQDTFDSFENSASDSDDTYNWRYQGRPETPLSVKNGDRKHMPQNSIHLEDGYDTPRYSNSNNSSSNDNNDNKNNSNNSGIKVVYKKQGSSTSTSNSTNHDGIDTQHVRGTTNNSNNTPKARSSKTPLYKQPELMRQNLKQPDSAPMPAEFTLYSQPLGANKPMKGKPVLRKTSTTPSNRYFVEGDSSVYANSSVKQQHQDPFFRRGSDDGSNLSNNANNANNSGQFTFGGQGPRMRPCSAKRQDPAATQENMKRPDSMFNSNVSNGVARQQPMTPTNTFIQCLVTAAYQLQTPPPLLAQVKALSAHSSSRDFKIVYLELQKLCHPDKAVDREGTYDTQRHAYTAFRAVT